MHPEFQFHGLQGVENIEDLKLSFAYLHINWNSVFEDLYFSIESIQTDGDYIEVTLRKLGKTKTALLDEPSEGYDSMVTIKEKFLIVNRTPDPLSEELFAKIKETTENTDLPLAGILSSSDQLIQQELSGKSYLNLAEDAVVIQQAHEIFSKIIK